MTDGFKLQTFENDVEAGHGQGFSIFSAQNAAAEDTTDVNQVTFEPLPDILAKTVTATALRPRISSIEKEQQRITAKHISNHDLFCGFSRFNFFFYGNISVPLCIMHVFYIKYIYIQTQIFKICLYHHVVLLHIIQYIENI